MKYKHICKGCSKEFHGRRNQEFHDLQCKIDYNNEKATILRNALKDNKILQKNHVILQELYAKYKSNPISVLYLQKSGFDTTAPVRRIKTKIHGYDVFLSNGIGYRVYNVNQKQCISIYPEQEIKNL
jgi:hypothetical protein